MSEITQTQIVLAEMLTENTGRHMLDSGGAYGRNWERNQGITADDFVAMRDIVADKYCGPTMNIFHYLDHWLDYDSELDESFAHFCDEADPDLYWMQLMEMWAAEHEESWVGNYTVNSYNGENILSQDIQFTRFAKDGEEYVALQIHGGCDIRGGYTKPRIFRIMDDEGFGWDMDSYGFATSSDREAESVTIDYRGGEFYWVEGDESIGGYYTKDQHPMSKWIDMYSDDGLKWDEENEWFICPDGDGHIEFFTNLY